MFPPPVNFIDNFLCPFCKNVIFASKLKIEKNVRLVNKDNEKGMLETETQNVLFVVCNTHIYPVYMSGEKGTICMQFVQTHGETQRFRFCCK